MSAVNKMIQLIGAVLVTPPPLMEIFHQKIFLVIYPPPKHLVLYTQTRPKDKAPSCYMYIYIYEIV